MNSFTYNEKEFMLNGKPFKVISGAMHYFRIVPEYWLDRLTKLKACGFNTVETYIPWNLHERAEGKFDFTGILDLERYITLAEGLGLNLIIRPGPYICAEHDFGGLPSWLLNYEHLSLRSRDEVFISKLRPYLHRVFEIIKPHLITNGGRVIMLQIENEYGSYGDDKVYLNKVKDIYLESGMNCCLFTSDGSDKLMLSGGTIDGILSVANFGSHPDENFNKLKEFRPKEPTMCGEFWCGWFDHWYEEHHVRTAEETVKDLESMLKRGASFNFYMFHGGTNFGFHNGANHTDTLYQPTITSYDYSSPLSESGDMTDTYFAVRDIIEKYMGKAPDLKVENSKKAAYGRLYPLYQADLFDNLENISKAVSSAAPLTMEELGGDFGYIYYKTEIEGGIDNRELILNELHDRALIFVNGEKKGVKERTRRDDKVLLNANYGEKCTVEILLENMGRVNYGDRLFDKKGILKGVRVGYRHHFGFINRYLSMDNLENLNFKPVENKLQFENPLFLKYSLVINEAPADTFIELKNFTKGFVTVNGFNIGRYYNTAGPQKTLYIPAPLLRNGENEIIVFESDGAKDGYIDLLDRPILG